MKIACFTPIKTRSTRVEKKNFAKIGGKPLYEFTLDTIKGINQIMSHKSLEGFDHTIDFFIDTDSVEIMEVVRKPPAILKRYGITSEEDNIKIIKRDPKLSKDSANGDHLLKHHIGLYPDYDIYCQLYITCPFQKASSIVSCLDNMIEKDYDSSFLGHENKTWFWYDGMPINYVPGDLPRSQDSIPVYNETTGFYAITKETWQDTKCRIGTDPYIHLVNYVESIDIDDVEDLELAKAIHKYAGL